LIIGAAGYAAADAKFAKEIGKIKDIEIGENLLKNNGMNIQQFAKFYDNFICLDCFFSIFKVEIFYFSGFNKLDGI
jgi:hypothetical protein